MNSQVIDAGRQAIRSVDPDFLRRWSPRAFDPAPIEEDIVLTMIEAARWAPSAYNAQPWRFVYELRDGGQWGEFVDVLLPFNSAWAQNASAIVFILSDSMLEMPGKEPVAAPTASFDTGAAWAFFALQATRLGLHTHAMAGLDHDRAAATLGFGIRFRVEAAIAVGFLAKPATLPEALRKREQPSMRREIAHIASRGSFTEALHAT